MIQENLPTIKGWVKITGINSKGEKIILLDRKNALVDNARTILAHSIAGDNNYKLDLIELYKAGNLLSSSPYLTPSYPDNHRVKFSTRFDENSFNDTFDELRLKSSSTGDFSIITGVNVEKDNTVKMEIEWILTINQI